MECPGVSTSSPGEERSSTPPPQRRGSVGEQEDPARAAAEALGTHNVEGESCGLELAERWVGGGHSAQDLVSEASFMCGEGEIAGATVERGTREGRGGAEGGGEEEGDIEHVDDKTRQQRKTRRKTSRSSEVTLKSGEQEFQKGQKRKRDEADSCPESAIENSETTQERENGDENEEETFYDEDSGFVFIGKRRRCGSEGEEYGSRGNAENLGGIPPLRRRKTSGKPLAKLDFAFPLPCKPPPPAPQFSLEQGHKLKLTVTYREPHYIFTVVALSKALQKKKATWPLGESFVLVLHKTKDREGRPMEADCPGPGERCCSLEVDENEIRRYGYVEKGMLHVTLKLSR